MLEPIVYKKWIAFTNKWHEIKKLKFCTFFLLFLRVSSGYFRTFIACMYYVYSNQVFSLRLDTLFVAFEPNMKKKVVPAWKAKSGCHSKWKICPTLKKKMKLLWIWIIYHVRFFWKSWYLAIWELEKVPLSSNTAFPTLTLLTKCPLMWVIALSAWILMGARLICNYGISLGE